MRITPAASGDSSAEENSSQQSPYISEMSSSSCARDGNPYHTDRNHTRTQSMRSSRVRNSLRHHNSDNNINVSCQQELPQSGTTSKHSVYSGGTDGTAWNCPRICIDNLEQKNPLITVQDSTPSEQREESPVIRLSLRKPKHWNLKLTTSASSPAIMLPIIHLVDERGDLLVNTRGRSDTFTSSCSENGSGDDNDRTWHRLKNSVQCSRSTSSLYSRKKNNETTVGRSFLERVEEDDLSPRSGTLLQEVSGNKSDPTAQPNRHNKTHHRRKVSSHTSEYGSFYEVPRDELVKSKQRHDSSLYYSSDDNTKGFKQHFNAENNTRLKAMSQGKGNLYLASRDTGSESSSPSSTPESCLRKRHKCRAPYNSEGDRLLEINSQPLSSYREASQLLRTGSDVVHLKLLRRRHSGPYSKSRHDSLAASPAPGRRSKRRQPLSPVNHCAMGSNVSRHSEKGLSGRRTQSSGNLCNGNKILAPTVGRILVPCSGGVGAKDRNKFCGSLPNHLDSNDSPGEGEPCCIGNSNNNNNNYDHLQKIHSGLAAPAAVLCNQVKNHRNEVELRLHSLLPHHDLTALHDQGYGSERSPEDEHPPPLPEPDPGLKPPASYPFITPEATFSVYLLKGSRGLGLSVTGGIDSGEQWPGLIRIKRIFPHQPAWQSGQLSQGDILLAANGVQLTGLTNYQALEVLRTTPNNVVLIVCRPLNEVFCILPPSEPPPPPIRDPAHSILSSSRNILPLPPLQTEPCGEFDILLTKVNRSLGFTLRKEDESVLGHYVRALVREPALSDGRIRPGDKIVAVNDVDISPMSHEEAVMFLRQCGDYVKLRLYRDAAQTPVSALSPSDETKPFKPKPLLRKEAMDMLCDLAVRKLSPGDSSNSSYGKLRRVSDGQSSSPCSSPRRRRLTKTPSPDTQGDRHGQKYLVTSHVANSDSSGEGSQNNTFTYPSSLDSTAARGHGSSFGSEEGPDTRPQRPNFLDLCGGIGLPSSSRKQPFTFTVSGSEEEEEETVGPMTSTSSEDCVGCLPTEPTSMPPLTNLSSTSSTSTAFSYRNPAYQSANPGYCGHARKSSEEAVERSSDQDIPAKMFDSQSGADGSRGLLKWKGVVFTPDNNEEEESMPTQEAETLPVLIQEPGNEVMMVELSRGWNSRLGFSLQADGKHTYISAVYADSVAAKDGRLQAGDQVLMVNDENVEEMSTAEIIDLLRKIRGTIGITILRKSGPNLQVS